MKTRATLLAIVLMMGLPDLFAHPGHHHGTGLPDAAAHILLGLQYLAALLVPAAAIALFLRSARRKKSRKATTPNQEK
jgi:hypothetical protein